MLSDDCATLVPQRKRNSGFSLITVAIIYILYVCAPPATAIKSAVPTLTSGLRASVPRLRRMNAIRLLCLFIGAASAFTMGIAPTALHVPRCQLVAIEPVETAQECVAESETGAEAEECLLPLANAPAPARSKSVMIKPTADEKRKTLMGNADSLSQCLSEAENGAEIEECEVDYDKLVTGQGLGGNMDVAAMAPVAAGVAVAAAAAFYFM